MTEDQFFNEKPQPNKLMQIVFSYLPFWPILVVLAGIGLSVAHVYLRAQVKMYVAAAKVLIKDPQKPSFEMQVLQGLTNMTEKKSMENEIIVLKSGRLMQKVVKDLNLYASVFNEGNVQTEALYKSDAPVVFEALNKDSVGGGGKYYFKIDWIGNNISIDNQKVSLSNGIININGTPYRVIVNNNYNKAAEGKKFFAVFQTVDAAAGGFAGGVRAVQGAYGSNVLDVSMQTPVPERGVDILNRLFEIYNTEGVTEKNQMYAQTMLFIDGRLGVLEGQLDSVEKNIMDFKAKESVTDLGEEATMYFENVKELDIRNTALDLQLEVLRDVQNYINSKGRNPGTVPSLAMVNDPFLISLLNQLYEAEFELEKARSTSGEKSEAVLLADERVLRIKADLRENLNNIRATYLTEKASNNTEINKKNSLLSQIPSKELGLLDINRQQTIKNTIYTYLLEKREETALASSATASDLKVLESAYSYGPISPIARNFYLTGFFIGLLAFILYVQTQEKFNNKVLFRSDIEKKTTVPVIAEIVQSTNKENIAIRDGKRTVIAEQFRALRTNLAFMGFNETNKCMLVTSSVSGEGKSFVAINLAISISLTGKRVAIMELDLRKPKISKYLQVDRNPGISSYLVGKATVDEICKKTAFEGLYVVSAGPIPPNPTELILLDQFGTLMKELNEKFDYIVIDTAPIGPVSDAQLLAPYVQTSLYVVRHAITPASFMSMIENLKRENKFPGLCVVFNGLKPRGVNLYGYGFGGYGNGYGYGYGYGHGYGYGYGSDSNSYYVSDGDQPGYKNLWGFVGWLKMKLRRRKRRR